MSAWETYCDTAYFYLWRVRRMTQRGFDDGFHLANGNEARALVDLLNQADAVAQRAKELVDRWDQPSWKDTAPTAGFIYALRDVVKEYEKVSK